MDLVLRLIVGIIVAAVIVWLLGAAIASNLIVYGVALLVFLAIVFAGEPAMTRWRR